MHNLGMTKPGSTIYIPFPTYKTSDGTPVTMTGLAVGDIKVYKNGGTTERASTSGYTLLDTDGIDFDTLTGIHGVSVDLSDDTTTDFWEAGARYFVVIGDITVDGITTRLIAGTFEIGYDGAALNTTIATLSTQASFTLDAGSTDNDAYNGCVALVHDKASAVQIAWGYVSDYVGSTKTVTLKAVPEQTGFTMAAGDNISLFPPANTYAINGARLVGDGNTTPWDGV